MNLRFNMNSLKKVVAALTCCKDKLDLGLIFFVCFVLSKSSAWSQPKSGCFSSSCLVNTKALKVQTLCGPDSDTQNVTIGQGCLYNNYVTGFKLSFCCVSTARAGKSYKKKCSMKPTNSSNVMWWPDKNGNQKEIIIDCPFAPPVEKFHEPKYVRFLLYTRNNTDTLDFKMIYVGDTESLQKAGFIKNAPVKLIIHGFQATATFGSPGPILREYYLKLNTPMNIIVVDWSNIASFLCYNTAAKFTRYVGIRSALLLRFILEEQFAQLKDIHVLGHSLGAQAAGFTGKRFYDYTNTKFPRITGFDPAAISFTNKSPVDRIDRTDADFVDIIHTAASDTDWIPIIGASIDFGTKQPVGHVDFFPNKGGKQPGCQLAPLPVTSPPCSHLRSFEFYAESIKPPSATVFRGIRCRTVEEALVGNCNGPETTLMGACTDIISSSNSSLIYYLTTAAQSPYAVDQRKATDYKFCPIP